MTHRRNPRRSSQRFFVFTLLTFGLIFTVLLLMIHALGASDTNGPSLLGSPRAIAAEAQAFLESSDHVTPQPPPTNFPEFSRKLNTADIPDTGYLKLVNRERAITTPVNSAHLTTVWPDLPARTSYVELHQTAFQALQDLFAAAGRANINSLFVASGFRGTEEQRTIYQNAADPAFVLPPGHSEHQLGLAADILTSANNFSSMVGSPEAAWLAEHAPAFGLILRYPADKQDITGVAYEPWHFRYVGRIHAWYMGERDFVLEEYIEYLQAQGGFQATLDGRTYYVLYQRPQNGIIFVPEHLSFNVSSANTGGYIVTAWR